MSAPVVTIRVWKYTKRAARKSLRRVPREKWAPQPVPSIPSQTWTPHSLGNAGLDGRKLTLYTGFTIALLPRHVPSWIGADQGHAASIRLVSTLPSPGGS